jgi:hypothetical protein
MQKEVVLVKELSTSTYQNMFDLVYLLMKKTKQCSIELGADIDWKKMYHMSY